MGNPASRATCATRADLPTPGGPHSMRGVCSPLRTASISRPSKRATVTARMMIPHKA